MKKTLLLLHTLLLLTAGTLNAGKKTDYYPNGKIAFRGQYTYVWQEENTEDLIPGIDASTSVYGMSQHGRETGEWGNLANLVPVKAYDGFCTFYYPDGSKQCSGTYDHGIKNGTFDYWYPDGKRSAVNYYVNGMADGTWQYWEANGKLRMEFAYHALSQTVLDSITTSFLELAGIGAYRSGNDEKGALYRSFTDRDKISDYDDTLLDGHWQRIRTFSDLIEKALFQRTAWDGRFTVNKSGQPYLEFFYKNNRPDGHWKIWEEGKLAFELGYENGQPVMAKEYIHTENNSYRENMRKKYREDSTMMAYRRLHPDTTKIFTSVEQMAEFPGGTAKMTEFIKTNLRYPAKAKADKTEGRVTVQLVIRENGSIDPDKIKILRGLSKETDEEAIRLIKKMPVWKPAHQNGATVKVYYTLPISFRLEESPAKK